MVVSYMLGTKSHEPTNQYNTQCIHSLVGDFERVLQLVGIGSIDNVSSFHEELFLHFEIKS